MHDVRKRDMTQKPLPKVAFVCVHNSCRSQIAEALGLKFASEVFESYSAGTSLKTRINSDAVRIVKEIYGIDMEASQHPKLIYDLPSNIDVVITMGCGVACPSIQAPVVQDWGLEDPTGKSDEDFIACIRAVEHNIKELAQRLS